MKLKAIFIIFNVLVVLSFLFVFFMPAFFLGWDYTSVFWSSNWYLAGLFVVVLVVLNLYFGSNWRLFSALEDEDWDAVISVMETRIYKKNRLTQGNIRLAVNAYVVTSRSEKVRELERYLREHRPAVLQRNALLFGIPHLLSNDGAEMADYYAEFVDVRSGEENDWIRWSYAFSLMLQQKLDEAQEVLNDLVSRLKPGVLLALSAYLLDAYSRSADGSGEAVAEVKRSITGAMSHREWNKKVEHARGELHVLVLSKLLRDVEQWLYDDGRADGAS